MASLSISSFDSVISFSRVDTGKVGMVLTTAHAIQHGFSVFKTSRVPTHHRVVVVEGGIISFSVHSDVLSGYNLWLQPNETSHMSLTPKTLTELTLGALQWVE